MLFTLKLFHFPDILGASKPRIQKPVVIVIFFLSTSHRFIFSHRRCLKYLICLENGKYTGNYLAYSGILHHRCSSSINVPINLWSCFIWALQVCQTVHQVLEEGSLNTSSTEASRKTTTVTTMPPLKRTAYVFVVLVNFSSTCMSQRERCLGRQCLTGHEWSLNNALGTTSRHFPLTPGISWEFHGRIWDRRLWLCFAP